ncbi:MAG: M12 family metallo-peptidase [Pyrinomonadaceae bacterium]
MNCHRCGRMLTAAILAFAQIILVPSYPNAYGQSEARQGPGQGPGQGLGQGRGRRGIDHHISKHESISLDAEDAAARVRRDGQLTIASASHNFQLQLTPHDLRARDYQALDTAEGGISAIVETNRVRTFKGKAVGSEAEARFTVDEETIEGVIITADEKYFVEPLRKYEAGARATDFVLYKGSDVYQPESEECGVTLEHKAENAYENFAAHTATGGAPEIAAAMTYKEVELATEADYEYVTALGGAAAANNEILSILNQIEGIYKAELGISFKVSYQSTWSVAADPYTQVESAKILEEFRTYWNSNHSDVARDLAHLWTGKDIYTTDSAGTRNMNNVGVAYSGVTCKSPTYGYGLTERRTAAASKVRVTSHEIGHNFGASHASGTGCDNTIMSAVGSSSTVSTFCQVSRDEINAHLSAYNNCLAVATDSAPTLIQLSAPTYRR